VTDRSTPVGNELDLRSLRYFVAAAEELHFTRAAARLFVAQQALSRDIARLERVVGTPLFTRTTRRVALTPVGERLLVRARELISLHDLTWHELHPSTRTIVVDLLSEGRRTGLRVLDAIREVSPAFEFRGTHGGGMGRSLGRLLAGDIDIALGRATWRDQPPTRGIEIHALRYEPLALLLPDGHPMARLDAIPIAALGDIEIDVNLDDPHSPEWSDLARQLLAMAGASAAPPHPIAVGTEETSHHLRRQGLPILIGLDQTEVAGGVIRPLVDPVPLDPWSMVGGGVRQPSP
jgi:DNA-binding transcriptional LysR family regulator